MPQIGKYSVRRRSDCSAGMEVTHITPSPTFQNGSSHVIFYTERLSVCGLGGNWWAASPSIQVLRAPLFAVDKWDANWFLAWPTVRAVGGNCRTAESLRSRQGKLDPQERDQCLHGGCDRSLGTEHRFPGELGIRGQTG